MTPSSPLLVLAGLAAMLGAGLAPAQTPPRTAPAPAPAPTPASPAGLDCMIQPHLVVQVGTASPGVIQSVRVDRGDLVRKGQPVVQLKADVERAALAVARERASQSGEVASTRGAHELAQREAQRAAQLVDENFVSRTYFDRQRAEVQVAAGRGEQAQERIRLAQREVELAAAQLNQRTVVSPIDGVVVERFVSPGEYVEQKPVLRIAAVDPLRVDVLVPAAQFGRVAVGSKATVVPDLLDRRAHAATVSSVDRVVDAASNTFRVRLELPNPGGVLPPGLRCKAELGMAPAVAAQPAASAAARAAAVPATPGLPVVASAARPSQPSAQPATSVIVLATQAQVRRTEPVEPAAMSLPVHPSAPATYAQIRRLEPVQPAAAPVVLPVVAVAAPARVVSAPSTPRLKMAAIEWPIAVATAAPAN